MNRRSLAIVSLATIVTVLALSAAALCRARATQPQPRRGSQHVRLGRHHFRRASRQVHRHRTGADHLRPRHVRSSKLRPEARLPHLRQRIQRHHGASDFKRHAQSRRHHAQLRRPGHHAPLRRPRRHPAPSSAARIRDAIDAIARRTPTSASATPALAIITAH